MSFRDIGAVFSRSYVIGFFVPAAVFFTVATFLTYRWYNREVFEGISDSEVVLAVTGLSLGLGLLLEGLWNPIVVFLFQGYISEARGGIRYYLTWPLYRVLLALQNRRFRFLLEHRDDPGETDRARAYFAWQLDRRYPQGHDRVLPTRFGNAVRASEDYSRFRWGVDNAALWPRVEAFLSEQEKELLDGENAQVAFFLNSCLLVFGIAIWFIVQHALHWRALSTIHALILVALLGVSYLLYYLGVEAVIRWGTRVRTGFDLHLRDVYREIGLVIPDDFSEEHRRLGLMLSQFFVYGSPIDPELWARSRSTTDSGG